MEQAVGDSGIEPRQIDRIVFVGGPTWIPVVFFEELFGRPAEIGIDPMECVASGAQHSFVVKPTALAVDDELDLLATYSRLLSREGYRIITA